MRIIIIAGLLLAGSVTHLFGQAPAFTTQPVSQAVAIGSITVLTASASSSSSISYQWRKDGTNLGDTSFPVSPDAAIAGSQSATLVLGNTNHPLNALQSGSYTCVATNSSGSTVSAAAQLFVGDLPSIGSSASVVTANVGTTVPFSITPGGTPPFTYQWSKDGSPIAGATNANFNLTNVQLSDQGSYSLVVTNPRGSASSGLIRLNVSPAPVPPVITVQPASQVSAFVGGSVSLSVAVSNPANLALSWTWSKDFNAIANNATATTATLQLNNLTLSDSGMYTVVVRNSAGSVVSNQIVLNVTSTVLPAWRLVNVSTRVPVGTGGNILIQGFVVSGNTSKQVLVRAIGPTLSIFGVTGVLANPSLAVYQSTTLLGQNTSWGGTTALTNAFTATGAFQLPANSQDSALVLTLAPGSYTAQVSGVGGTTGVALVEVYEMP